MAAQRPRVDLVTEGEAVLLPQVEGVSVQLDVTVAVLDTAGMKGSEKEYR